MPLDADLQNNSFVTKILANAPWMQMALTEQREKPIKQQEVWNQNWYSKEWEEDRGLAENENTLLVGSTSTQKTSFEF